MCVVVVCSCGLYSYYTTLPTTRTHFFSISLSLTYSIGRRLLLDAWQPQLPHSLFPIQDNVDDGDDDNTDDDTGTSFHTGSMILVPLPNHINNTSTTINCTDKEAFTLQNMLYHNHYVEVPIKCVNGRLYVRVSCHVYNDLEDFARLAKAVNGMRGK